MLLCVRCIDIPLGGRVGGRTARHRGESWSPLVEGGDHVHISTGGEPGGVKPQPEEYR